MINGEMIKGVFYYLIIFIIFLFGRFRFVVGSSTCIFLLVHHKRIPLLTLTQTTKDDKVIYYTTKVIAKEVELIYTTILKYKVWAYLKMFPSLSST